MTAAPDSAAPPLAATVVIATRERPEMLLDTVRSVLSAPYVPREIVVIDQSRSRHAGLADLGTVRGCEVRYVHSRTQGVSSARNVGLRLASQETVVILDDDVLVRDDSLRRLIAGMSGGGDRIVTTGRVLAAAADRPGLAQPPYALVTRSEAAAFRGRQSRQVVPGMNVALPRSVMIEIGGYDERLGPGTRFPAGEDHDLSLRLLDAGCEVRHVPEAVVLHRAWRSQRELVRLRWRYARGVGGFYAKHASIRDRHTLGRAAREARTRASRAAISITSSPKTTAVHLFMLAGLLFGAVEWSLRYRLRALSRDPAIVLAYHAVSDLSHDRKLARYGVSSARLAEQLDALGDHGWTFVDLDALLRALEGEQRLPGRAVLLTFDDGYADLLTSGIPVLTAREIPAVAFAVSGRVGGTNEWDRELGAQPVRLLDADGLRAIAERGVEVGSHGQTHRRLPLVAREELAAELVGSAAQLEALGLRRPRVMSYPYGLRSTAVASAVREAGYAAAFTIDPGAVRRGSDRFALPRVEVLASDTPLTLRVKIATAGWPVRWRRRVLRLLRIRW